MYGPRKRQRIGAGTYGQGEVGVSGRVPWGLVFAAGGFWLLWKMIDRGLSKKGKES